MSESSRRRWKDPSRRRRRLLWRLHYALNTAGIAAAWFWFSRNVLFYLIARHDPLVTYLGVTIVALLSA